MPDSEDQPQRPAQFAAALDAIRHATPRAELIVTEISAPGNLAPYSVALSADVTPVRHGSDSDFGTGRFILLYDPDEPESWGGPFRVVCFAQAPLETDIGIDPFLADVAWAWLVDALDVRGAEYTAASGTATKILSSGFGELAHQGDGAQIELRASWSPLDNDLGAHVEGWGELLCMLAGLPPTADLPTLPRRSHPAGSNARSTNQGSTGQGSTGQGSTHAGPTHAGTTNQSRTPQDGTHEPGAHEAGPHRSGTHQAAPHHAAPHDGAEPYGGAEPHDARHDEAPGTGGIVIGPLDSIGPSLTSMRRSGPGLPTLGVTATGLESGGMETVGVDTAGPDPLGTLSAGRETVGMNAVGMNAVGLNAVGLNAVRPNVVGMSAVGTNTTGMNAVGLSSAGSQAGNSTMAVADLSARRAARG